jgi:hypothetical protein
MWSRVGGAQGGQSNSSNSSHNNNNKQQQTGGTGQDMKQQETNKIKQEGRFWAQEEPIFCRQ